jgi:hypothetical protein
VRFEHLPGVIDLGFPETRFKRAYKVLRIQGAVGGDWIGKNAKERKELFS